MVFCYILRVTMREREREREYTIFCNRQILNALFTKYFREINTRKNSFRQKRNSADTNLICYIRAVFYCIFIIVHISNKGHSV